ncbi:MAG: hypothetical protein CMO74_09955 [Verrucomicrobiales bacterium]|nr:hypothetical protein [Verrucomicrobiales bacterium]|tara:strand:+ start:4491 stop:4937 length:447 start_codon:yes stop_codon:yes gene_type:complete
MPSCDSQNAYDDAIFAYTQGDYTGAIERLESILAADPTHFEARLSLGMAHYRQGDYARAIAEGRKAEEQEPKEQRVHTNLSLFYMRQGDKEKAEHHGLQARIAGWRGNMEAPEAAKDDDLKMSAPTPEPVKLPTQFPDMPWKKKKDAP